LSWFYNIINLVLLGLKSTQEEKFDTKASPPCIEQTVVYRWLEPEQDRAPLIVVIQEGFHHFRGIVNVDPYFLPPLPPFLFSLFLTRASKMSAGVFAFGKLSIGNNSWISLPLSFFFPRNKVPYRRGGISDHNSTGNHFLVSFFFLAQHGKVSYHKGKEILVEGKKYPGVRVVSL